MWDFQANPTGLFYYDEKLANKRIAYGRWSAHPTNTFNSFPISHDIGDFDMKADEQLVLIINQQVVHPLFDTVYDFMEFHFDEIID